MYGRSLERWFLMFCTNVKNVHTIHDIKKLITKLKKEVFKNKKNYFHLYWFKKYGIICSKNNVFLIISVMESCLQEQCEYRIPFILVFAFLFSTVNNKQVSLLTLVKKPKRKPKHQQIWTQMVNKNEISARKTTRFFCFFFVKPKVHQYKHIKGVL